MYYIEAAHPAIITQEQFDKSQEIRKSNIEKFHSLTEDYTPNKYTTTSMFAGKLKCPHCGKSYIKRKGTVKTDYSKEILVCPQNKMKVTCPGAIVSVHLLNQVLEQQLNYLVRHKKHFITLARSAFMNNSERLSLMEKQKATEAKTEAYKTIIASLGRSSDKGDLLLKETYETKLNDERIKLAYYTNELLTTYNIEGGIALLNKAILKCGRTHSLRDFLEEVVDYIIVRDKDFLEFKLKHIATDNCPLSDLLTLEYLSRKTTKHLKHVVM